MTRERVLAAAYACVARYGMAKTTMEDVAREASLSRATVYRHFPAGKDQLLREVVAWEAARFFDRLTRAVADRTDFGDLLVEALVFAHRAVTDHEVLRKITQTEPERLLPLVTVESDRLVRLVRQFLVLALQRSEPPLPAPGAAADAGTAADYVARMLVSHIGGAGGWDLADRAQVRRLVETELLPCLR